MTSAFDVAPSTTGLSPRLDEVQFRSEMLRDPGVQLLNDRSLRCLMKLVALGAAARAWTYTPPDSEGWLRGDDRSVARSIGISISAWTGKVKPALRPFLDINGDRLRVSRDWFLVSSNAKGARS